MSRYLAGQENVITKLASETPVDAVLEASLEEVTAKMNRMVASWDGVEEVVGGKGSRTIARLSARRWERNLVEGLAYRRPLGVEFAPSGPLRTVLA